MQRKTLLIDAIELFLLDRAAARLTQSTHLFYRVKLSVFVRWCESENLKYLQDITTIHIRRFQVYLQEKKPQNRKDKLTLSDL